VTASATVNLTAQIENDGASDASVSLTTTIVDASGAQVATHRTTAQVVAAGKTSALTETLSVANAKLWSTTSPNLYSVQTQVFAGGVLVDTYVSPLGIRTFRFDANTGFSLNAQGEKINGVCLHQDLGSLGSAINYRALEKRLETLKAMGANAVRTSHNPPAPELLEICDRLGIVVMDEAFDCWYTGKNKYDYGRFFNDWAQRDLQAMVARDRNHPSVVLWSIGNEIPDVADTATAQKLINWVKAEDTTRPITQNMSSVDTNTAAIEDLLGFSYGEGGYDSYHSKYPTWKLIASESSSAVRSRGVYHLPATTNILTDSDNQCSSYDNSVVGWGSAAETSWNAINTRPFMAGEFVWTGYDYIGEPTPYAWPAKSSYFGMVDTAGFPKDIYYFYQSHWNHDGPAMVHIVPMDWTSWSAGQSVPVFAYSNCDSVELFLNGASLGSKAGGPTVGHLAWNVSFAPGTLRAECTRAGNVAAVDEVKTAGPPAAVALSVDRNAITADGNDLAYVEADIVDAKGMLVPQASNLVAFAVTGAGALAGVDNGNAVSLEPYKGTSRSAFSGKAMAVVRSLSTAGTIHVSAALPVDVAEGKTATADSEQASHASNGNDGNATTRWSANDANGGHYWTVDLGSDTALTGSQVMWETAAAYGYKIETSSDGTAWTVAVDRTGTGQIDTDTFAATARYVRITVTSLPSGAWASFYELRLFSNASPLGSASVAIQTSY
jgi:beta-galactosidase